MESSYVTDIMINSRILSINVSSNVKINIYKAASELSNDIPSCHQQ